MWQRHRPGADGDSGQKQNLTFDTRLHSHTVKYEAEICENKTNAVKHKHPAAFTLI